MYSFATFSLDHITTEGQTLCVCSLIRIGHKNFKTFFDISGFLDI